MKFFITCLLSFICFTSILFAQENEITMRFIGNCGLHLSDGTSNMYIDFPYKSGAFNYMEYDDAEIDSIKANAVFLFTHKHPDHYASSRMRKTLRKKKGQKFGKWNIERLEVLNNSIDDFSVEAIETEHSLSFKHYSYLIIWHEKRIYFYGDTETADIALTIKNLDWAFIPYWTAQQLNERNEKLDTKMLGIYHFYPQMKVVNHSPEKVKMLTKQGETIRLAY